MSIDIDKLDAIYSTDFDSRQNQHWITVPDSKKDELTANALGSSGGNPGNGWKIHISIDPNKISQAVTLVAQALNEDNAPRVSIKFAGKHLAQNGQPSKQIAFIFYEEELQNKAKISAFLNRIESLLTSNDIGQDPRPINSDEKAAKTKYDTFILNTKNEPTRFNYRNEQCIVLEDHCYHDDFGYSGNFHVQDQCIFVKQSYFLELDNSQKNNPGNQFDDPLAVIRIASPELSAENKERLDQDFLRSKESQDFLTHLQLLRDKATIFQQKGNSKAENAATQIYNELHKAFYVYAENPNDEQRKQDFKNTCKEQFNSDNRKELEKHRGTKKILVNLAIAIASFGVGLIALGLMNLAATRGKHFFFHPNTDSAEKLNALEQYSATLSQNNSSSK